MALERKGESEKLVCRRDEVEGGEGGRVPTTLKHAGTLTIHRARCDASRYEGEGQRDTRFRSCLYSDPIRI